MSNDSSKDPADGHDDPNDETALVLPGIRLAGMTAPEAVRYLRLWFGDEAIKDAVADQTDAPIGNREKNDWPALRVEYEADAREWLIGNDPFAARKNNKIAASIAKNHPDQSFISTRHRLNRKIRTTPHNRKWWTIILAAEIGRTEYPYSAYLRAVEACKELHGASSLRGLDFANAIIAAYVAYFGSLPHPETTFRKIEEAVARKAQEAPPPKSA